MLVCINVAARGRVRARFVTAVRAQAKAICNSWKAICNSWRVPTGAEAREGGCEGYARGICWSC